MADEGEHALTFHRYGKAEVRVVHVDRSTPRHVLRDLNVSTALSGDFEAAYTGGDNTGVLATDSQKNAVFSLARSAGVRSPEDFAALVASELLATCPAASRVEVEVQEYGWARIGADVGASGDNGAGHDHAFERAGGQVRTASLQLDRGGVPVLHGGVRDLVVLKTTGSEYSGFLQEQWTTLAETRERILATSVTATWRYRGGVTGGFDALVARVREQLVTTFAAVHSLALQQTLHAMGSAVLDAVAEVEQVHLVMPNKHHFLVNLSAFGQDNPHAVYHADDRPYGLIEGTVTRGRNPLDHL